ncbi:hypothetical protein GCM10022403_068310 [Streptomyces coacervatus]|uniref:Uncharacterized protein n=1 Tax=Streptomyces coacervatus TaxID=647381 RepID=A0ABP7IS17_9ACTN
MRPVTPFMAIRTVLRVTSFPSQASYSALYAGGVRRVGPTDERHSKRFLYKEKLASDQWSGQDRDRFELFEGTNSGGFWP